MTTISDDLKKELRKWAITAQAFRFFASKERANGKTEDADRCERIADELAALGVAK